MVGIKSSLQVSVPAPSSDRKGDRNYALQHRMRYRDGYITLE